MIEAINASQAAALPPQMRVLNQTEAALVWLLSWSGDAEHTIAAKMGTMTGRVTDILAEKTHVGSRDAATKMVGADWVKTAG